VKKKLFYGIGLVLVIAVVFLLLDPFNPITIEDGKVYVDNRIVPDADPESFERIAKGGFLSGGIYRDKDYVYASYGLGSGFSKVEGADPETYEPLERGYARDKNYGYKGGRIITGSHGPTFEFVKLDYTKDNNYVYHYGGKIEGSDGPTFEIIDDVGAYGKDINNVYSYSQIIDGADVDSFEVLDYSKVAGDKKIHNYYSDYAKDKNQIYYKYALGKFNGTEVRPIPEADVGTFKVLDDRSAQDKNNRYVNGEIIE